MKLSIPLLPLTLGALIVLSGCASPKPSPTATAQKEQPQAQPQSQVQPQPAPAVAVVPGTAVVRIKAGSSAAIKDSAGNVWQPDQGFDGGDVIDRDPATVIANTRDAALFLTEHYGMNSFSCKIPNGKYLAKLYFAETYDGITGPDQRVFSFNVQGHAFKHFDVWKKAGKPNTAYVETIPVDVTNGTFRIDFTAEVENPEINAIEIIPQS